jgi:CheY-like chemotaxis protein
MRIPPTPDSTPDTGTRPRVLVVDDYPENCRLIYFYLRGEYDVIVAASAEEALTILDSEPVDLIVMDINLKNGMNGIEATQRIRQREATKHVAVLAVSAYAYPDDRARFLEAGFDDYIPKPIFKESMLRKVAALMASRNTGVWVSTRA